MSKKNLRSINTDLAALAGELPSQRVGERTAAQPAVAPVSQAAEKPAQPAIEDEPVIQFSLSLRKSLRKQLARMADDKDLTMRAFVLQALKKQGLDVRKEDLKDLRKSKKR